jgi:hypothetical protein
MAAPTASKGVGQCVAEHLKGSRDQGWFAPPSKCCTQLHVQDKFLTKIGNALSKASAFAACSIIIRRRRRRRRCVADWSHRHRQRRRHSVHVFLVMHFQHFLHEEVAGPTAHRAKHMLVAAQPRKQNLASRSVSVNDQLPILRKSWVDMFFAPRVRVS